MTYETLLINGVNLASYVSCIQSLDGLYTIGTPRGENVVIPGVDGEIYVDKSFQAGVIELGIFLAGSTTTQFNDNFRALKRLVQPGQRLNLTRRMSFSTGAEDHVASGEYASGLAPELRFMRFGRTSLGLRIHDGLWYGTGTQTITSSGTVNVLGDIRTHRMTITMPNYGTVTNTTTGHTITTAASGGNVLVDVENMTATQNGNSVSHLMTWNKRYPMRLAPGANTFSGSAVSITYTPAYL